MITTKCNRNCPHCMFFCSPQNKDASNLDLKKTITFIKTIPKNTKINEISIYWWEPTLDYKRLKTLIKQLPKTKKLQILTNGYLKDKIETKKFELFCKWGVQNNTLIKISNDVFHDIFQDKSLLNNLISKYNNLVWKRRENTEEFIMMWRRKKHPTLFIKSPNCTLATKTIIIQQDGKINFCCGGYSAAIWNFEEKFDDIIKKRHEFILFLKKHEGKITHNTCEKCRELFSEYYKTPLDRRWG